MQAFNGTDCIRNRAAHRLAAEAARLHEGGDYAGAVRLACHAYQTLLGQRLEAITALARREHPWPRLGTRILRTELGVRVEFLRDEFSKSDSRIYLSYFTDFCQALPTRSLREALAVRLRNASRLCLQSHSPLALKRLLLRALIAIRFRLFRMRAEGQHYPRALEHGLGLLFHEPQDSISKMMRSYQFQFELNYARLLLHLDRLPEQGRYLGQFHWPEKEDYLRLVANDSGSRVLTTIHMGDFVGAFELMSRHARPGRGAITLRRERESEREQQLFSGSGLRHQVIRHGQQDPVKIISALRQGNHTLSAFFDLQADFGETIEVLFFGQPARFVKGPAQLAIAGHAPIIPFVTYETGGQNRIDMEALIETELLPGETLSNAAGRITQQLVTLAEKWIRNSPSQWKYLPSLFSYLKSDAHG